MANLLATLLIYYGYAIFARIILSWFPLSPGGPMATIFSFLYNITEPVLGPLRRVIPPIGAFDISPLVAFFAIEILANALARAG